MNALRGVGDGRIVADIYASGQLWKTVEIPTDQAGAADMRFETADGSGFNILSVSASGICVSDANCPGLSCVLQGTVSRPGESIACLPHRLLVVLRGQSARRDIDAVSG